MYNIKEQGVKENFITVIEEVLVTQSSLTLFDPMDCSLPGSSVDGIFQARMLEWVAISFSRDLPDLGIELVSLVSPALAGRFFSTSATWEAQALFNSRANSE